MYKIPSSATWFNPQKLYNAADLKLFQDSIPAPWYGLEGKRLSFSWEELLDSFLTTASSPDSPVGENWHWQVTEVG